MASVEGLYIESVVNDTHVDCTAREDRWSVTTRGGAEGVTGDGINRG